jgi:hypothetical protein
MAIYTIVGADGGSTLQNRSLLGGLVEEFRSPPYLVPKFSGWKLTSYLSHHTTTSPSISLPHRRRCSWRFGHQLAHTLDALALALVGRHSRHVRDLTTWIYLGWHGLWTVDCRCLGHMRTLYGFWLMAACVCCYKHGVQKGLVEQTRHSVDSFEACPVVGSLCALLGLLGPPPT